MDYTGYLAPHTELIIEAHRQGLSTRTIAEQLYTLGVRATTSEPLISPRTLSAAQHIANLRAMVLYAQIRLGLRARKSRGSELIATPRMTEDGTTIWEI
jgi:hypothetical protein